MSNTPEPVVPEFANHSLNYIELPVTDMARSKEFYSAAFGWTYLDYGPTYAAFTNTGLDGGFDAASDRKPSKDGALVVIYAVDLEKSLAKVKEASGEISIPIFSFPGGRRFHFVDPSGNELAVASYAQE